MKINRVSFGAKLDIATMKIAAEAIKNAEKGSEILPYIKMWEMISDSKGEIFVKKKNNIEKFYFFCDRIKTPRLFFAAHCKNSSQSKLMQIYINLKKVKADLKIKK